jgi:hypothetical protein
MARGLREPNESARAPWAVPVVVGLAALALGLWRASSGTEPEATEPPPAPVAAVSADEAPRRLEPRCAELSPEPFIVGDAPPPRPATPEGSATAALPPNPWPEGATSADAAAEPDEDSVDPTAPFAVEIGRGALFDGGFAAGARRDAEGGAVAMVATIGADGRGGKLVRLGRSRGDLDPPVVAGAGASVLAVLLEPNAGGRALKVARVTGTDVTWGPEFSEGRDDSLAVDIAASGARAVVVWDDLSGGAGEAQRSSVMLASLDVVTMRPLALARPVSSASLDASSPRLVSRPGGFWLGYVAHGDEDAKKKQRRPADDDDDQGEPITTSWVEIVPLDESGGPAGAARAITPKNGHVLSFDLALGENGNALVAFRDDDVPTGSGGGKVSATLVRLGGGSDPHVLVEEAGNTGAPTLLPGWISLASVNGATRIAAMTPSGELLDALAAEPSLGAGEPIAATRDVVLWARPLGKAMRLSVVRCRQRASGDAGAEPGDAGR